MFGREQHARRLFHRVGIRRAAQHRHRLVVERALEGRLEDRVRHFDQNRPGLAAAHRLVGAPHHLRQFLHRGSHRGIFGNRGIDFRGAEGRRDVLAFRRKSGRDHQHRHILRIGLRHAGEGILDAGPMLGGKDAVLLARADAAEAVGHADAHALLPAEDGADVELGAGIDQRIARVAGEKLGPLALEDFCDDIGALHLRSNSVWW
jgi:hypothetical protein